MSSTTNPVAIGKQVFAEFSQKNVSFMAAGIAYNAFVSLAPLLILLLLAVSVAGGGLEDRLLSVAEGSLPGPIADVVGQILAGEDATTGASVVGLVVLVWGTLKIFRGLDTAFSEIYETVDQNTFVDKLVDGVVVLIAVGVSIVATVAVSAVFATFTDSVPFLGVLTPLVLVAGLVVAFVPMYYRFPDTDLGWREVLPGAVFAAVGWAALQGLFQVYLVFKGDGSGGFFGGVLVVVTWLYFSGMVILLGAVLNAVVGGHATAAPGGVGRGAGQHKGETESQQSLEREQVASYLRDLRRRLSGYHEELTASGAPTEIARRPIENEVVREREGTLRTTRPIATPEDRVEIVERSRATEDGQEWTVTLRWQGEDGAADG